MNQKEFRELDLTQIPNYLKQIETVKELYQILYEYELTYNTEFEKPKEKSKFRKIVEIIKE